MASVRACWLKNIVLAMADCCILHKIKNFKAQKIALAIIRDGSVVEDGF
jgi:hypothetical protein